MVSRRREEKLADQCDYEHAREFEASIGVVLFYVVAMQYVIINVPPLGH